MNLQMCLPAYERHASMRTQKYHIHAADRVIEERVIEHLGTRTGPRTDTWSRGITCSHLHKWWGKMVTCRRRDRKLWAGQVQSVMFGKSFAQVVVKESAIVKELTLSKKNLRPKEHMPEQTLMEHCVRAEYVSSPPGCSSGQTWCRKKAQASSVLLFIHISWRHRDK